MHCSKPKEYLLFSAMNMECRKRSLDEPIVETKRPRYNWYFKLESESSCASQEDDTESVYSIQNQETGRLLDIILVQQVS